MKNQTIFVTGATSGIGYAVAKTLADNGYTVMASARKSSDVDKLIKTVIETFIPSSRQPILKRNSTS